MNTFELGKDLKQQQSGQMWFPWLWHHWFGEDFGACMHGFDRGGWMWDICLPLGRCHVLSWKVRDFLHCKLPLSSFAWFLHGMHDQESSCCQGVSKNQHSSWRMQQCWICCRLEQTNASSGTKHSLQEVRVLRSSPYQDLIRTKSCWVKR